jgi:hypothetical protein
MSIRNLNETVFIQNKLIKFKATKATIKAFDKEMDMILDSKYKVNERLKELKKHITKDNKTITVVKKNIVEKRKVAIQEKKEAIATRQTKINETLSPITKGFQGKARIGLENVIKKLGNVSKIVKQLPINYKNKNMVAIKVNKTMTRQQIKALGNSLSEIMKKQKIKGSIGIAVRYANMWAPAKFTNFGEDVKLWSALDSDAYDEEPDYNEIEIYLNEYPLEEE